MIGRSRGTQVEVGADQHPLLLLDCLFSIPFHHLPFSALLPPLAILEGARSPLARPQLADSLLLFLSPPIFR